MGCSTDATLFLDKACSGRSSCEYFVVGPDLAAIDPCPRGATSYLEIQYECIKGTVNISCRSSREDACKFSNYMLYVTLVLINVAVGISLNQVIFQHLWYIHCSLYLLLMINLYKIL